MKSISFNDHWYVRHAEEPGLGEPVTLPHDAMLSEPRTAIAEGGLNVSWFEGRDYVYTKTFTVSAEQLEQHMEYKTGLRTDGLTMSIYSSLMVAATPIGGAIIQALNALMPITTASSVNYIWIETVAYGICAVLILFFDVEKNLSQEQAAIAERKK